MMTARPSRRHRAYKRMLMAALLCAPLLATAGASVCYGTVANGRLDGGVPLPTQGTNFVPYSSLGVSLGRTYVHRSVRDIVVEAYAAVYLTAPGNHFMYGETGLAAGGRFTPHRTHQNGLSVDFMVPVLDQNGKSVPLPATTLNKFGYALEFDASGAMGELRIDFEAVAEHLYQLAEAAKKRDVHLQKVIFQKELVTELLRAKRGDYLRATIPFMKATPWIKHDEHYHVDFSLPCRPLGEYAK
ncbi:MAG TPA: penicillin-insensitive murein endopeptidase [Duganella sp.]|jgi:penicillin-insensitive murein endopeptidase